ncbi:response regulator transcription factor [Carboxydothermus pertinax]|uniref:Stage 0 sporulation protein A homolog n=1 Tax=Carboxydothermus pertinax TaxID=870242 RepID=A0A1L8CXK0_9THEO|nr:response regulator transcription factor [Carboxydothermus pertinax]GAV23656.1 DNA-binding response regulator [Carboxydothermus pertinax]
MKKILLVDDEEKIRNVLKLYLEKEGFTVIEAQDGEVALKRFSESNVDLIILDLMLPGLDGMEVAKEIRKKSMVPIIMLTARGEEIDKILGLELGADDYVVKPFSPREVIARIKAVLRRTITNPEMEPNSALKFGILEIYPEAREIRVNGEEILVTPLEFELLLYLVNNRGKALSREQLLTNVWGYDYFGEARTVDTHITRLREKLKDAASYIKTVWGVGYKFEVKNSD